MLSSHDQRPALENPSEHITAPKDAMQIDLIRELHPSGGYENIVTAMDVISSQDAKTIANIIINIMTKHAYLPTPIISDKRSAFRSQVIKEAAKSTSCHNKACANNCNG